MNSIKPMQLYLNENFRSYRTGAKNYYYHLGAKPYIFFVQFSSVYLKHDICNDNWKSVMLAH